MVKNNVIGVRTNTVEERDCIVHFLENLGYKFDAGGDSLEQCEYEEWPHISLGCDTYCSLYSPEVAFRLISVSEFWARFGQQKLF